MSKFPETLYNIYKESDNRIDWDSFKHKDYWNKTCNFSLEILKIFVSKNGRNIENSDFFSILINNAIHNNVWTGDSIQYKNLSTLGKKKFDIFVETALIEIK